MSWWEVLLVFVGIPAAVSAAITGVVLLLSHPRVPEGIAAVREQSSAEMAGDHQPSEHSRPPDEEPEGGRPDGQTGASAEREDDDD